MAVRLVILQISVIVGLFGETFPKMSTEEVSFSLFLKAVSLASNILGFEVVGCNILGCRLM